MRRVASEQQAGLAGEGSSARGRVVSACFSDKNHGMTNAPLDHEAADALWKAYAAAHPELATDTEPPSVERFGDSPALADELLDLVLNGPKRATAGLVAEFLDEGQP